MNPAMQTTPQSSPQSSPPTQPQAIASQVFKGALLSLVAGYVDVVGFIALFGLFTAHVTGNFVMLGVALAHATGGVLSKLLALPVFALSVATTKIAVDAMQARGRPPLPPLLVTQGLLLAAFMLAGCLASPMASPDMPSAIATGMLGVAAMAVQNAQSRIVLTDHVPTTIMTGNSTQVIIDLVELRSASADKVAAAKNRLRKMVPAIAAFAAGAVSGAYAYVQASYWCLAVPILILLALAYSYRAGPAASLAGRQA